MSTFSTCVNIWCVSGLLTLSQSCAAAALQTAELDRTGSERCQTLEHDMSSSHDISSSYKTFQCDDSALDSGRGNQPWLWNQGGKQRAHQRDGPRPVGSSGECRLIHLGDNSAGRIRFVFQPKKLKTPTRVPAGGPAGTWSRTTFTVSGAPTLCWLHGGEIQSRRPFLTWRFTLNWGILVISDSFRVHQDKPLLRLLALTRKSSTEQKVCIYLDIHALSTHLQPAGGNKTKLFHTKPNMQKMQMRLLEWLAERHCDYTRSDTPTCSLCWTCSALPRSFSLSTSSLNAPATVPRRLLLLNRSLGQWGRRRGIMWHCRDSTQTNSQRSCGLSS